MRVFDDLSIENGNLDMELFDCLPQRAKAMFFAALQHITIHEEDKLLNFIMEWGEDYVSCKSPIEKIFFLAFNIVRMFRSNEFPDYVVGISVFPQFEVETESKKYCADFYIVVEGYKDEIDIIVECDGHDFHEKTKKQVAYNNEREYAIKKAGYDILRFSGSQIYENPFKCANDIFDYLLAKEVRS